MNRVANKPEVWTAWASSNGAELAAEITESHGFGLRAPRSFSRGDVLLTVPKSLAISSSTVLDDKMAKWVLECGIEGPHLLQRIVVYLALSQSKWTPYFKMLPDPQQLHLPFAWSQDDIEKLEGTSIGDATTAKRRFVGAALRTCPPLEGLDPGLWVLAYEWVASRTLTHPETGEAVLVPILDLVNHSTAANARYDTRDDSFILIATQDLTAGDEIFIDYGPRSSGELLFKYGFTLPEADTTLIRTYDPLDPQIRAILDLSCHPEVPDEETRKMLEAAYCILVQFVGQATFQLTDGEWNDDFVVLLACEDLVELKSKDGVYDLYIGDRPIDPQTIHQLRNIEDVNERGHALAQKLAAHFRAALPDPDEKTRELVQHEHAMYAHLA